MKLEEEIVNGTHDTTNLGIEKFPKCFIEHITIANNKLTEPYTEADLSEITRNIKGFLYVMTENRIENLEKINCQDLIEFIDVIPEPEDLLYYKNLFSENN